MANICKHVEKYDFYGLKKQKKIQLARFACSHKPIYIHLVEGPTPKPWKFIFKRH